MNKIRNVDKQTLAVGKHHRKIEKEKGFLPPPPFLIPEVEKLFEAVNRMVMPSSKKVTYTRRSVFRALQRKGSISQNEVARFAHISGAAVCKEIASMEKEGLIRRERDELDGRIMRIYLTEKGSKESDKLWNAGKKMADIIMRNFTPEQEKELSYLLLDVRNNLVDALDEFVEMEQKGHGENEGKEDKE